jgi:flagellar basal body P-ring formation protein FlgA
MGKYAAVILALAAMAAFGSATVEYKDAATVTGPDILLSDIAVIHSADAGEKSALSQVRIGRAALPGYNVAIPTEHLRNALKPFYDRGADIAVSGASEVSVKTASRAIYEVTLAEELRKRLFERMPWPKAKVQVTFGSVPEKVVIPDKDYRVALEQGSDCDWRGNEIMRALIMNGDEIMKEFPVSVRIKVFGEVCIADKKLKRGTLLSDGDVRMETRDVTEIHENTFSALPSLMGKKLKRTLLAGMVVCESMIEIPPLVRRGDKVVIVSRENTATVTSDGVARQDGLMGQKVQVRNSLNNKLVDAYVTGPGEVDLKNENGGQL